MLTYYLIIGLLISLLVSMLGMEHMLKSCKEDPVIVTLMMIILIVAWPLLLALSSYIQYKK